MNPPARNKYALRSCFWLSFMDCTGHRNIGTAHSMAKFLRVCWQCVYLMSMPSFSARDHRWGNRTAPLTKRRAPSSATGIRHRSSCNIYARVELWRASPST